MSNVLKILTPISQISMIFGVFMYSGEKTKSLIIYALWDGFYGSQASAQPPDAKAL